jgi:hypothetical protein
MQGKMMMEEKAMKKMMGNKKMMNDVKGMKKMAKKKGMLGK